MLGYKAVARPHAASGPPTEQVMPSCNISQPCMGGEVDLESSCIGDMFRDYLAARHGLSTWCPLWVLSN